MKASSIISIGVMLGIIFLVRLIQNINHHELARFLNRFDLDYEPYMFYILIGATFLLVTVLAPTISSLFKILAVKDGIRYYFTSRRIEVWPDTITKDKKKADKRQKAYSINYKDIKGYDLDLSSIRLHLRPSWKALYSGVHLAGLFGIPIRVFTPEGKAPEAMSIITTHMYR